MRRTTTFRVGRSFASPSRPFDDAQSLRDHAEDRVLGRKARVVAGHDELPDEPGGSFADLAIATTPLV